MIHFRRRRSLLMALPLVLLAAAAWQARVQPPAAQAFPTLPGWNLVSNPMGTLRNPAYTFQMGDSAYETAAPGDTLTPGLGYWVYSSGLSAFPLGAGSPRAVIQAPAGQFVMIGDPSGIFPAQVTGADAIFVYNPQTGYVQLPTPVLLPGQGAFAMSVAGGAITLLAAGTSTLTCSLIDTGSACPVNGACPTGYPVAVTQDALAHSAPAPGLPPLQGQVLLCFNDLSQAVAAGYQVAADPRVVIYGPASATTSDIRVTVLKATLETPAAFLARVIASGDQLCAGCDVSGASAVVTVDYGIENIYRPPTLVSPGSFLSARSPQERSFAYFLLASQHQSDPAHVGVPAAGSLGGVFAKTKFSDIDKVDWRLDTPFIDPTTNIPQPHGPNMSFELNFRGPLAGQVVAYGTGSTPLQPVETNPLAVAQAAAASAAAAATPAPLFPAGGVPYVVVPAATPSPTPAGVLTPLPVPIPTPFPGAGGTTTPASGTLPAATPAPTPAPTPSPAGLFVP